MYKSWQSKNGVNTKRTSPTLWGSMLHGCSNHILVTSEWYVILPSSKSWHHRLGVWDLGHHIWMMDLIICSYLKEFCSECVIWFFARILLKLSDFLFILYIFFLFVYFFSKTWKLEYFFSIEPSNWIRKEGGGGRVVVVVLLPPDVVVMVPPKEEGEEKSKKEGGGGRRGGKIKKEK